MDYEKTGMAKKSENLSKINYLIKWWYIYLHLDTKFNKCYLFYIKKCILN